MIDPEDPNPADSPPENRIVRGMREEDNGLFIDVNDGWPIWCIDIDDGTILCSFPFEHCTSMMSFRRLELVGNVVTEFWGKPGEQENSIPLGVLDPELSPDEVPQWDKRIKEIIADVRSRYPAQTTGE